LTDLLVLSLPHGEFVSHRVAAELLLPHATRLGFTFDQLRSRTFSNAISRSLLR
jgi:hypothetical protein